jgi:hypothetical protein
MIAALYVERGGVYWDQPGIDPWDEKRDARLYDGPYPVIAHPPCARWGRYWGGAPTQFPRLKKGDDGGCFLAALSAVRRYGGILEHPQASHAWREFRLAIPPRNGGWIKADWVDGHQGWTCCVEQSWYGHPARKATWLYASGVEIPDLKWGKTPGQFVAFEDGYHSKEERARAIKTGILQRLSRRQRLSTPIPFRDLLISIVSGNA